MIKRHRVELLRSLCCLLSFLVYLDALAVESATGAHCEYRGRPAYLDNWLVVGPFEARSDQAGITTGYHVGTAEIEKIISGGGSLHAAATGKEGLPHDSFLAVKALYHKEYIDIFSALGMIKGDPREAPPTFYAEAIVRSESDIDASLLLGSDGAFKVWLNGEVIAQSEERRKFEYEPFNFSVPIALHHGENVLLFKIVRVPASCALVAEITPRHALAVEALKANHSFLNALVVGESRPLSVQIRGVPPDLTKSCIIRTSIWSEGKWYDFAANPAERLVQPTKAGIYKAELDLNSERFSEEFLVGDVNRLIADAEALVAGLKLSGRDALNFDALLRRLAILRSTQDRVDTREWQRKLVFTLSEISNASFRFRESMDPWARVAGLHIRGFQSTIDGNTRHYRIFVPHSASKNEKYPLGVVVATSFSGDRPFIESSFIAHQIEAERIGELAEEFGLALLWPGYATQPNGNPCEFTHFDDVIRAVSVDYPIDRDRIYLLGTCQGGVSATMMAERWPRRFAALGLVNPITSRPANLPRNESQFEEFSAYGDWIQANAPNLHLDTIKTLPTYVIHDGGAPGHGTIEQAQDFVRRAELAKVPVRFDCSPSTLNHFGAWRSIFAWAVGNCRTDVDERVEVPAGGQPVMSAFAAGFVVVRGTTGSLEEIQGINRVVRQFEQTWQKNYFGPCRVVDDVHLEGQVERNCNLVLVGNANTNAVWLKYERSIPIRWENHGVSVKGKFFGVPSASVGTMVENPNYPNRKIILVGSSEWSTADFGDLNWSIDAWFDVAVWRRGASDGIPEFAERFDSVIQ